MPLLDVIFSLRCVTSLKQVLAKISPELLGIVQLTVLLGHQVTLPWRGFQDHSRYLSVLFVTV